MLRSMFSSVSGLRGHQTMMDVIGNNIANVNTAGYKASATTFEDLLSQAIKGAGVATNTLGGTNPAQIGLGVRMAAVSTNFAQGATQLTNRTTDLSLQGDGFFVTAQDGERLYTRLGSFSFDTNGRLATADGAIVQGWTATNGAIDTNAPIADLRLPLGQLIAPTESAEIRFGGNLPADVADGTTLTTSINVFDQQGNKIPLTFTWTKAAADTWDITVSAPKSDPTYKNADGKNSVEVLSVTDFTFDPANGGRPEAAFTDISKNALNALGWNFTVGGDIGVNMGAAADPDALHQFAGTSSIAALEQDGSSTGFLRSFSVGADGTITGVFSNGRTQRLGQVALASFNNPPGLEKAGNSSFRETVNSGMPQVGTAGSGGRGNIAPGTLEMSNVDLAQEFTNLIVAQRGFQANSRVITASDELLQDLVNLKR
ncbi:MAG: flagellar hook protein FlgE [Acidimicrobiia bacterium]